VISRDSFFFFGAFVDDEQGVDGEQGVFGVEVGDLVSFGFTQPSCAPGPRILNPKNEGKANYTMGLR
jgi:hypothetical protein